MTKMILTLVSLFSISALAEAPNVTIPYKDLLAKQEVMHVSDIQANLVKDDNGLTTIQLIITASNACGRQTLVDSTIAEDGNREIQFYQVGGLGPHIQPACSQVIEYYWQPKDYDIRDGQSKDMILYVGPVNYRRNSVGLNLNSIIVKAKVTMHVGVFPNGIGQGYYATYSDLELDKSVVSNSPNNF